MSMSAEKDERKEQPTAKGKGMQIIRGLPMSTIFSKERIEECLDYVPRDGDVIIATYPKTGTTWMQYIVHQILTKGESFPNLEDMMGKLIPYIEMAGTAAVDALTSRPRVYKHHFPYDMVKKNPMAKVIYVYRRPEDTFASYYPFMKNILNELDFDEFFEGFLTGDIGYGCYFHNVLSYWKHRNEDNLLMVSYETLYVNRREEILRIAKFLGEDHYNALAEDETKLDNIIRNTSFEYMKKNLVMHLKDDFKNSNNPTSVENATNSTEPPPKKVEFFRKGVIGDGKQALKPDQLRRLRDRVLEKMEGTDILLEWLKD